MLIIRSSTRLLVTGAGNYANSSLVAFEFSGFNPDSISYFRNRGGEFLSVRPPAFAANVILDFGVFGLIFCIYWLRRLFSSLQASCYPLASAFLLVVFINGSVGNPVVWLCFAVILRLDHEKKIKWLYFQGCWLVLYF